MNRQLKPVILIVRRMIDLAKTETSHHAQKMLNKVDDYDSKGQHIKVSRILHKRFIASYIDHKAKIFKTIKNLVLPQRSPLYSVSCDFEQTMHDVLDMLRNTASSQLLVAIDR